VAFDCSTPPAPVLTSLAAMATTATSPRPLVSPAARDRKFYTGMAIVMLFTALIGFSRTYFFGLIFGHATTITGRVPNATVHLHALLFMSWLRRPCSRCSTSLHVPST
jgi:hypothetical protein